MQDAAIIGAGPAGWAAAAALRARGLTVTLVAPDPEAGFVNGYGVWVDDLEGAEVGPEVFLHTWPAVRVHVDATDDRRLARPYARIDNRALASRLRERARGATLVAGKAAEVRPDAADGLEVRLEGGQTLAARVVVDASGHESRLIRQEPGPEPSWQVAHGRRIRGKHPFAVDEAVFMDFRPPEASGDAERRPSFLYVLPESEDVVFVEETSLAARPPVEIETLEARLERRLAGLGVEAEEVLDIERCFIPMGGPPPPRPQPVVAFGGAARMVHPASGYLLARVLRTAPRLAAAVKESLERAEDREARALRAWAAVWPRGERVSHELYRFGNEVLLRLAGDDLRAFFAAFFSLQEDEWRSYLSGTASPPAVRRAMRGVFAHASWRLRLRLMRAGVGEEGRGFRKSLFSRG